MLNFISYISAGAYSLTYTHVIWSDLLASSLSNSLLRRNDLMNLGHQRLFCAFVIVLLVLEEYRVADLLDCGSLARSVRQQTYDEILKSLTQVGTIHCVEVVIIFLVLDHVVVLILENLGAVGEFALYDDEEEHAHGEQVDLRAIVHEFLQDFWSDVAG